MMASLSIISIWSVLLGVLSFISFDSYKDTQGCQMSWMRPSYAKLKGFDAQHTRLASRYSIYLYREDGLDVSLTPSGIPVLFIPGNAGSYKQARSIASYCAHKKQGTFDVFTADLTEDLTAFHGSTLLEQAEYINDAISYILSLYEQSNDHDSLDDPTKVIPKSVILVGHSMGGVVARSLVTLPNYTPESVNTILTLSTPHILPPVAFESDISKVYELVNEYWRQAFSEEQVGRNPLSSIALISIAGGNTDTMVASEYAAVSSLVPPSNGFTTFTSSIPGVWTSIDHQAIVWCHQCRKTIAEALFDIVDPNSSLKTVSLQKRMEVFAKYFLTGLEFGAGTSPYIQRHEKTLPFNSNSSSYDTVMYLTPSTNLPNSHFVLPLDGSSVVQIFSNLYSPENRLKFFLCSPGSDEYQCNDISNDLAKLPRSVSSSSAPYYSSPEVEKLPAIFFKEFTAQQYHPATKLIITGDLFHTEFVCATAIDTVSSFESPSNWNLLSFQTLQLSAGVSDITIEGATSSLFAYEVRLVANSALSTDFLFSPLIRQYVDDPYESKFHVNALNRRIILTSHGSGPYMPYRTTIPRSRLHLQVFISPVPESQLLYNLQIKLNLWASLGNIIMRYRTTLASLPLAVVCCVFLTQLRSYYTNDVFLSFPDALVKLISFGNVLLGFAGLYLLHVSLGIHIFTRVIRRLDPMAYSPVGSGWFQDDLYVGTTLSSLAFIGPLLLSIAVGLTILIYVAISLLLALLRIGLPAKLMLVSSSSEGLWNRLPHLLYGSILLLAVGVYVPYQLGFMICTLRHLFTTVYAAKHAKLRGSTANSNTANYCISLLMILVSIVPVNAPVLAVWFHHTLHDWTVPFASHHNILAILPIMIMVEMLAMGFMLGTVSARLITILTSYLVYVVFYCLLFGSLHTYVADYLVDILAALLIIVSIEKKSAKHRLS